MHLTMTTIIKRKTGIPTPKPTPSPILLPLLSDGNPFKNELDGGGGGGVLFCCAV